MRNRTSDLRVLRSNATETPRWARSISKSRWYASCILLKGALGFSGLRFWLFFLSVFRSKTSIYRFFVQKLRFFGFGVLAVCGFSVFFSIWFSVFAKNTNGFSDLISDAVSGRSNSPFGLQMSRVVSRDFRCKQTPKVWTLRAWRWGNPPSRGRKIKRVYMQSYNPGVLEWVFLRLMLRLQLGSLSAGVSSSHLEKDERLILGHVCIYSWKRHALCYAVLGYARNRGVNTL